MNKKKESLVLQLGSGKYWVATSTDPEKYIENIREGNEPKWVLKYGFVKVKTLPEVKTKSSSNLKLIEMLMCQYGIDNVRGTSVPGEVPESLRKKVMTTSNSKSTVSVVLRLKSNKYWVAETTNPERYIKSIEDGGGSKWVLKYQYDGVDSIVEDSPNITVILSLMSRYGMENVRGTKVPSNTVPEHVKLAYNSLHINKNYLYVLALKEGKYYVGKTTNIQERVEQHRSGENGASWTKMYEPLPKNPIESYCSDDLFEEASRPDKDALAALEELKPDKDALAALEEDRKVKELMLKYGVENVRGGSYSSIRLDEGQLTLLNRELNHARGVCLRCGALGHWIRDCPQ